MLSKTEGTLHVSRAYLEGLKYDDLELKIKNGFIEDYSCRNFASEEENRKYIYENVLYRHPTLPVGEFAVGTNTTAYRMGRKFGIEARLPVLIAEKTGPHFAVGDTCYSREEEVRSFNPDGKEIVAKENEASALRRTDPEKAYFNCHTDITLPFEELGSVTVVRADGSEEDLIRDGRFVVPGTEELNGPLEDLGEK